MEYFKVFIELHNGYTELGKESYPFQNDFETQLMRVEEMVKQITKR